MDKYGIQKHWSAYLGSGAENYWFHAQLCPFCKVPLMWKTLRYWHCCQKHRRNTYCGFLIGYGNAVHASTAPGDVGAMLCSDASLVEDAILYTDFGKEHPSHYESIAIKRILKSTEQNCRIWHHIMWVYPSPHCATWPRRLGSRQHSQVCSTFLSTRCERVLTMVA